MADSKMKDNGENKGLHVVAFPFPLQGHMNPMFHFCNKLASKGLTVTFVTTHDSEAQVRKAHSTYYNPFSHARSTGLDIRSAQISDGFPPEYDRILNANIFLLSMMMDKIEAVDELIHDLNQTGPKISCIIADTIFPWMISIAKKFELPLVSLWTQPATVFSIFYHSDLLFSNGLFSSDSNVREQHYTINYIPGVKPLKPTDLPSYMQPPGPVPTPILRSFECVREAVWVLCNSVQELEINALAEMQCRIRFLAVGPMVPLAYLEGRSSLNRTSIGTSMWAESDCRKWLDSKARSSVIYVSFGSYANVSKAQIEEMAMGLLESKQAFLWVVRPGIVGPGILDVLPDGFMDMINEQGLVVSWTSQLEVLSHPSVGGFLTHCGWNSVVESMCLGVPMLGFPLVADQYTNCKLIEDEWKVGMRLGSNKSAALVERSEIASYVELLMEGSGRKEMLANIKNVRDVMKNAVGKGGSSDKELDLFVEELKAKVQKNSQREKE
eukprot:Gb_32819 [translate_table: standard]